jgi:small neutral amino acid transporter SnatA (MarC family)
MSNEKPGARRPQKTRLLKPGMLTLAATCLWSAGNEPAGFDAASLASWLLGAFTVALLSRAALALAGPLLRLLGTTLSALYQPRDRKAEP